MEKTKSKSSWLKLDNAAKIYPSVASKRTTAVFRLSVTLFEEVNSVKLQQALDINIKNYPYFNMRLKNGFFWSYLETVKTSPQIKKETQSPCRKINKKKDNKLLYRVLYFRKKISLEVSHILTDGAGALIFLKALVIEYFKLSDKKFKDIENHWILN